MRILLIDVPYDCGQLNTRMGAGPTFLVQRGLAESLGAAGHDVRRESVRLTDRFHTEWNALVALQRQIAAHVRTAARAGERAIVLSGNCGPAALGVLGGLGGRETATVWMDAHADFNTPETSPSGFLDGMAAAIAVGHCWRGVASAFEDFEPMPEDQLVQFGVRSVDPGERDRLARSRVLSVGNETHRIATLSEQLSRRVRHLYVHVDLDVIDDSELRANLYATSGGPGATQVVEAVRAAASSIRLTAASITALDPSIDPERSWTVSERVALALADGSRWDLDPTATPTPAVTP